jgi:hypothetical protein
LIANIKKINKKKVIDFIIYFIAIQNIISIFLIPLYSMWGISFTFLTYIGNFFIAPLLSLFLFISLLFFIFLLCSCTFSPLVFAMKYLSFFIVYCLSSFELYNYFLISFIYNPLLQWSMCFLIGCFLIYNSYIRENIYRLCIYSSCALFFIIFICKVLEVPCCKKIIFDKDNNVAISYLYNNKLYIFDYRKVSRERRSNKYWINFSLIPECARSYGTININCYYAKKNINELSDYKLLLPYCVFI